MQANGGEVRQSKPLVYQNVNGERKEVAGRYALLGKQGVGFRVGDYDKGKPLIIDPVLVFSTYLGGNGNDNALSLTVDGSGNAYISGQTATTNFPTMNPLSGTFGGGASDAFITKMNPAGSTLIYSTYLGGNGDDYGSEIAIDGTGNAYVTGRTSSTNFPLVNPVQATFNGNTDFFVSKLGPTGNVLTYSTYLGGSGFEFNPHIAVDSSGNAYLTGQTASTDFPTANALQPNKGAGLGYDAFISKLDPPGGAFVYSTYLGGSAGDYGTGIVAGASGQAYISGYTESADFPTINALQPNFGGGTDDGFVAQIDATGSTLVYSTFLGGSGGDAASNIAIDGSGCVYLTGRTSSTNFPTVTPIQSVYGGDPNDAFVTKINASGSAIVYSTYLGGSAYDYGSDIVVDSSGNAYLSGYTASTNFPTANPSFRR